MRHHVIAVLAIVALACACSRKEEPIPASGMPASAPAPHATAPEARSTTGAVNVVAADMGGAVEELTGNYGPGYLGRRLIDGLLDPAWRIGEDGKPPAFPLEAVFSFYERRLAMVAGLALVLPKDARAAPSLVEVWTSMAEDPGKGYAKVATATIEPREGEQAIEFDPAEARYVKLRILSGASKEALEIAEVRVLEARRDGYQPLFDREPLAKRWKGSPREAAQRGLDWLQQAAPDWAAEKKCFGCHVQAQVLMGQAVALEQGYRVNLRSAEYLNDSTRDGNSWGTWSPGAAANAFGGMAVAYGAEVLGIENDKGMRGASGSDSKGVLYESANTLVGEQNEDGSFVAESEWTKFEPPILQGKLMSTANALVPLRRVAARSGEPRFESAATRGLKWIEEEEPKTTQDHVFKVVALMHYGTPAQKRVAWSVVELLTAGQQPDGGWKESEEMDGSNAFATGQVLYAFKQAGVSVQAPVFRRGVDFLLGTQVNDPVPENGTWQPVHTASHRQSTFAPTMWAVIGLAGAYGAEPAGALKVARQASDKPLAGNLVIVLDVSGSMNSKLEGSTRWKTALGVLDDVVASLPDDLNVGVRVYGHRQSSKSPLTCKDTELVVPIAKLDRERISKAASKLKPRGETPLVYSVLAAVEDLKSVGGGSVILITDGEESCRGDAMVAASQIASSNVNVALNIVGFTLTGKAVEAELGAFARSTGGAYYAAQDGSELTRAVKLAALNRLPYDILNRSGKVIASGETSDLSRGLGPGDYRIRIEALGQVLEEPFSVAADETTTLGLGVENNRFVIKRHGE